VKLTTSPRTSWKNVIKNWDCIPMRQLLLIQLNVKINLLYIIVKFSDQGESGSSVVINRSAIHCEPINFFQPIIRLPAFRWFCCVPLTLTMLVFWLIRKLGHGASTTLSTKRFDTKCRRFHLLMVSVKEEN